MTGVAAALVFLVGHICNGLWTYACIKRQVSKIVCSGCEAVMRKLELTDQAKELVAARLQGVDAERHRRPGAHDLYFQEVVVQHMESSLKATGRTAPLPDFRKPSLWLETSL